MEKIFAASIFKTVSNYKMKIYFHCMSFKIFHLVKTKCSWVEAETFFFKLAYDIRKNVTYWAQKEK